MEERGKRGWDDDEAENEVNEGNQMLSSYSDEIRKHPEIDRGWSNSRRKCCSLTITMTTSASDMMVYGNCDAGPLGKNDSNTTASLLLSLQIMKPGSRKGIPEESLRGIQYEQWEGMAQKLIRRRLLKFNKCCKQATGNAVSLWIFRVGGCC